MKIADFNPFDPVVNADPYPWYSILRAEDPVHWSATLDAFVLSRNADVAAALRDVQTFSSAPRGGTPQGVRFLLGSDPPEHTALRPMLNRRFTPNAVSVLRPDITRIAIEATRRLVDAKDGEIADFMAHVAYPVPVVVIARLMGIPAERGGDFRRWADAMVGGANLDPAGAARAFVEMRQYFLETASNRLEHPGPDLISRLLTGSQTLTPEELWGFCSLLLIAGTETTTNLIGNAVAAVLADPELQKELRANPLLIPDVVEETLRHDAPVQAIWRLTRRDAVLAGHQIPSDSRVLLLQGSANRDELAHPDADRFDPHRDDLEHLGFGVGIHFCLGAPLARMEAELMIKALLDSTQWIASGGPARRVCPVTEAQAVADREGRVRRPSATQRPRVRRNPVVRGFRELPIALPR